ncbi:ribonuclease III [Pseudonocardiaceae bacterium YIM PH 21723]|nr:ribonuclease III [Pseudonocardiaceae bacterium YIM PH 21723]
MNHDHAGLRAALGLDIDHDLIVLALTHRSYAYEHELEPNERLEFLGDAAVQIIITEFLFRTHRHLKESDLARLRAFVVCTTGLARVARQLGLGDYLLLGKGEERTGGRDKEKILADALEAVVGAAFLQYGMDGIRGPVLTLFENALQEAAILGPGLDWKSSLQELVSILGRSVPEYRTAEDGPDHRKRFTAVVRVDGETLGHGEGSTKKDAEQKAAAIAYTALRPPVDA